MNEEEFRPIPERDLREGALTDLGPRNAPTRRLAQHGPTVVAPTEFLADEEFLDRDTGCERAQDLARTIDDDPTLPLPLAPIAQRGDGLDAGVLRALDRPGGRAWGGGRVRGSGGRPGPGRRRGSGRNRGRSHRRVGARASLHRQLRQRA